jgi:hypothetical protein
MRLQVMEAIPVKVVNPPAALVIPGSITNAVEVARSPCDKLASEPTGRNDHERRKG